MQWIFKESNNFTMQWLLTSGSNGAIVINYCILYAKQHIYLEKLNYKKRKEIHCRLPQQYIKNGKKHVHLILFFLKFDKFSTIYENL